MSKKKQQKQNKDIENVSDNTQEVSKVQKNKNAPIFVWSNDKLPALAGYLTVIIIFLVSWTKPDVGIQDSWYAAVRLVDSANKVLEPNSKERLLEQGGKELREILDVYEHPRVMMFYGYYFASKKMYDSAAKYYVESIERGKGGTVNQHEFQAAEMLRNVSLNKAQEFLNTKDYANVLKTVEVAYKYKPNDAQLNFVKAIVYHNQSQLDSAIEYYARTLVYDAKHQQASTNLNTLCNAIGNQNFNTGNYEKAAKYYGIGIKFVKTNPDFFYNYGICQLKLSKPQEAVKFIQNAVNMNPSNLLYKQNLEIAKKAAGIS